MENYRPVSILPPLSKLLERIPLEQISVYLDKFLSDQQCGFRKGYSMQHCFLNIFEKQKNSVDKDKSFGALLTDLSIAFDCLDHELLTAKLSTYGFTLPALRLTYDYLSNRRQRTKINDNYSSWSEILFGVPQWSILDPRIFSIFLADLFFGVKIQILQVMQTIVRPFTVENNIDNVIVSLEQVSDALFNWFKNNRLKYNVDKYHVLISTNKPGGILKLETTIDNSECKKLLAVKIDVNLNFNDLISEMYKKASRKIFAFARVTPFMGLSK